MKATLSERAQGAMFRGGLAIPPSPLGAATKMALYTRYAAIPLAMGALSSLENNIADFIFGAGIINGNMAHLSDDYRVWYEPLQADDRRRKEKEHSRVSTQKPNKRRPDDYADGRLRKHLELVALRSDPENF